VINKGKLLLVDGKDAIMAKLGRTEARIVLTEAMSELPAPLAAFPVSLEDAGRTLRYRGGDGTGRGKREIVEVLHQLMQRNIAIDEVETRESSLEDIFVDLVENRSGVAR
jgi:ABC-2 type transport system ATP-binding protein